MFMSTRYKKKDPAWRGRPQFPIDDSLAKLFECLTIEYCCSKLISPKYKDFRNQNLRFEHKTRLNNAIWRAWHIQYKLNAKPRFCQFEAPFSDQNAHSTPQAVILEGRYWTKRLNTVSYERPSWRKPHLNKVQSGENSTKLTDVKYEKETNKASNAQKRPRGIDVACSVEQRPSFSMSNGISDQEMFIDSFRAVSHLPDTLFSSLEPLPKVSSSSTEPYYVPFTDISDTIQPTLDHLNPCLDDLMDNFEEFIGSAMWNDYQLNPLYTLPEEQKDTSELMNVDESNTDELRQSDTDRFEQSFTEDSNYQSTVSPQPSDYEIQNIKPEYTLNNIHNMAETSGSTLHHHGTSHVLSPSGNQQSAHNQRQHHQLPPNGTTMPAHSQLSMVGMTDNTCNEPNEQFRKQVYFAYSELPPKLQAPNLAAHLQAGSKARSKSAEEIGDVSTPPPSVENVQPKQPSIKKSTGTKTRKSALPRNRSDSSLIQVEAQSRKDSLLSTKERRRSGGKSKDGEEKSNFHRNLSDSSLSSLSNSPRRTTHILPKGIVTALPVQQPMVMPLCPPGIYPGPGPTLLVQPQPPVSNDQGHARLYIPKSSGVPLSKHNVNSAQTGPSHTLVSPIIPVQPKGNMQINVSPQNQSLHCEPFPMMSKDQMKSLMQMLEKGASSDSERAKQISIYEQIQQQVNAEMQKRQQESITSQNISTQPFIGRENTHQPMDLITSSFNPSRSQSTSSDNASSPVIDSPGIMQQSFNQNSVTYILPAQSCVESMQVDQRIQIAPAAPQQTSHTPSPGPAIVSLGEGVYVQLDDTNRQSVSHIVGIPNAFSNVTTTSSPSCSSALSDGADTIMSNIARSIPSAMTSTSSSFLQQNATVFTSPHITSPVVSRQTSLNSSRDCQAKSPASVSSTVTKVPDTQDEGYCRKENRRRSHITAEQRRRGSIKAALDEFLEIVPALRNQKGGKVSKAVILQKATSFIVQLQGERRVMTNRLETLKAEVKELNQAIQECQEQLPATGASISDKKDDLMNESFINYVKARIQQNRSFWIFGIILRPLFESFQSAVSTVTAQEFLTTVFEWVEKSCSLPALRPVVSASLRKFCSCSSILTDPSKIEEQALHILNTKDPTGDEREIRRNEENNLNQSNNLWSETTGQHLNQPIWTFHAPKTPKPSKSKQDT